MKTVRLFFVTAMLLMAGAANAQLGDILNKVQSATGNSALSTAIGVITDKLVPSEQQVQGTWAYEKPAVLLESSNTLANIGGAAVTGSIENKLQGYLDKIGIRKGKLNIVFNSDNTFSVNYGTRGIKGTYKIQDKKVCLTFKGRTTPCKVTPQLSNGSLVIVTDGSKLKDFITGLTGTTNNATLSTISSLLNKYKGLQLGIRLQKK